MLTKLIDLCLINKYPQLDASGLENLRTNLGNVKLLPSSKDYDWVSDYKISEDYVCDGEVITLGKARYANIKYHKGLFVSANNVIIESKNQNIVLTKFLYYYCLKNNKKFYVEGTTYPKFDMPSFYNSALEVPSVSEQKNIIETFDAIMHLMKNEEKQLKLYDELIKSRFIELFENKGYAYKQGRDLFKFSSGKFLAQEKRFECGVPTYGGNGIAFYTDESLVDDDTIIIGRVGAYCGNARLVRGPKWITDNALYISKFKTDDLSLEFLEELMKYYDFHQYAGAAAQPKITQKPLEEHMYLLPPKDKQIEFTNYVKLIDKLKFTKKEQLLQNQLLQ